MWRSCDEELERLPVPSGPFPTIRSVHETLEHGEPAPLLALVDVREVHLDDAGR